MTRSITVLLAVAGCSSPRSEPAPARCPPPEHPAAAQLARPAIDRGMRIFYTIDLAPTHARTVAEAGRLLEGALPGASHRIAGDVIELAVRDRPAAEAAVAKRCDVVAVPCHARGPLCVRITNDHLRAAEQRTLAEAAEVINRRLARAGVVGFASVADTRLSVELAVIPDEHAMRRARELVDRSGDARLAVLDDDAAFLKAVAAHARAHPARGITIEESAGDVAFRAATWMELVKFFEHVRRTAPALEVPRDRLMAYERQLVDGRETWRSHLLADSLDFPVADAGVAADAAPGLELSFERHHYDTFSRASREHAGKRLALVARNRVVGTIAAEAVRAGRFTVPIADTADAEELVPLLAGGVLPASLKLSSVGEWSLSHAR